MQNLFKKKYQYKIFDNSDISHSQDQNFKSFLFSPIPLSESLHIGHLYTLIHQDTLRRLLEKNSGGTYTCQFPSDFSPLVYKAIGNQTLKTEKIIKQKKQNENKLKQLSIPGQGYLKLPLSEDILVHSQKKFSELHTKGLINIEKNIVNWDSNLRMDIMKDDVHLSKQSTYRYEIKFFIDGKGDTISIFSYTPHTVFSTIAIAVHPKDRRFKKFLGKYVIIPIINKKIPIITDENINMIQDQGAQAINPGHDADSLSFAKINNLPTDVYSIDEKGNFTSICGRFSGKPVQQFKNNVIKFLEDIGNLSKEQKNTVMIQKTCYTEDDLHNFAKEQIYLCSEDSRDCDKENNAGNDIENNIHQMYEQKFLLSSYARGGSLFPLLWNSNRNTHYIFTMKDFINNNEISNEVLLTLLLINLSLEGRLSTMFTLEKCIQLLFEPSYTTGITKYESYLASYKTYYNISQTAISGIQKLLVEIQTDFNIKKITEFVEQSKFFQKFNTSYTLNRKEILGITEEVKLNSTLFFNQDFLNTISYLEYFSTHYPNKAVLCEHQENILLHRLKSIFLENNCTINFRVFKNLSNNDGHKFSFKNSKIIYTQFQEIQKEYGPDVARVILLKSNGDFDELVTDASYLGRLIQKIRNMCRLVFSDTKNTVHGIFSDLKKNITACDEFDLWILDKTNEYLLNTKEHTQQENFLNSIQNLEEYILFYLDHYLEIQKYSQSTQSKNILKYCLIFILQEIDIYFPILCKQIREIINYSTIEFETIPVTVLEYKANLFNDIITKIKTLKLQQDYMKHETIECAIQCGPDMQVFLKEYGNILKNMLNIDELKYFEDRQELGTDYFYDTIIDMTVAIKKTTGTATKKDTQQGLQKQIEEIEDEIQRKKILLGRIISLGDVVKINKKKSEIKALKDKLELLNTSS